MLKISDIQSQFANAIISGKNNSVFIKSNFSAERFNIYSQTIFENLCNALKITFPGIWKIIGEECANAAVYKFVFLNRNFPITGCIDDWGDNFPEFLAQSDELKNLTYLKDYARLEWFEHLCYYSKASIVLSPLELKQVEEEQIGRVRFSFCPSVFFLKSNYSLDKIQELLKDSNNNSHIDINSSGAQAIISRSAEGEVITNWIAMDYWHFIYSLKNGDSLEEACCKYDSIESNLSEIIGFMLNKKLIEKIL